MRIAHHHTSLPDVPPKQTLKRPVPRPSRPHRIEHCSHREPDLDTLVGVERDVHANPVPVAVEKLVRVQQACKAGNSFAWEELEEWREVLRADLFRGVDSVPEMVRNPAREEAFRTEGVLGA